MPQHDSEGTEEDLWDSRGAMPELSIAQETRKRHVMLACACLLGLGSHFGAYVLGPIKSSLKTSESSFASLIASFELLNTVTPLLSGFLVPRFGAANVGLVATGVVLVGQIIVCVSQGDDMNMAGTICGLLLFGGGISPVSVVQETIILSNNTSSSKSVGRSVALGLVLGKTSSFIAGASSDWLHSISPRMPFAAATLFAAISFTASIVYSRSELSISRSRPSASPATVHKSGHHGPIDLASYARFGDPFWFYIAICFFAGTWYTTIHLSTNLLQDVYEIGQRPASEAASILLLSPTFMYPLAGWLLDKRPELMASLYIGVPTGLACSLSALIFLSSVVPYTAALLGAAFTCGLGPLLSVLVVPRIVNSNRASAALALHKSLEMSGGILFQTLSALLLFDPSPSSASPSSSSSISTVTTTSSMMRVSANRQDSDSTLFFLLGGSLVQLGLVGFFWALMRRRGLDPPLSLLSSTSETNRARSEGTTREASLRLRVSTERLVPRGSEGEYGLLASERGSSQEEEEEGSGDVETEEEEEEGFDNRGGEQIGVDELTRGKRCLVAAGVTIISAWLAFVLNLLL